jgi:predicted metalloendopeptidase
MEAAEMMRWSFAAACLVTFTACSGSPPQPGPAEAPPPAAAPVAEVRPSGLLLDNFDQGVRPQDDLYRYVNGSWLAKTEIPADRSNYGSFVKLQDDVERSLHVVADEAASARGSPAGSRQQWLGDFYASYMDEARANALGAAPLAGPLAEIDAIRDRRQLVEYFGRTQRHYVDAPPGYEKFGAAAPLRLGVGPDLKNPDRYVAYVDQFGLGLPDREYFLGDDAKYVATRKQYQAYIGSLLEMAGRPSAAGSAAKVVALETRLARAQWSKVELRDVEKGYNPHDVASANRLTPGFDWDAWRKAAGVPAEDRFIIGQPTYLTAMAAALREVPLETWKDYLRVRVIDDMAPYLSEPFVRRHFEMRAATSGARELSPRWKRGLQQVEFVMGDVMGEAYVKRHFPPQAKQRMDVLVANLLKAFGTSIDELEWMTAETRRAAHAKLAAFTVKIGYPEKWKDYPGLEIRRDDLVGNVFRAREANYRRELAKLGQPVDRTEWHMTPQTVNAYYNPVGNEIVFPAAILQPPFFDMNADDAVNYGGIGAVIGHEISHGFDDQGRKFDGQGMLRDWWTEEDNTRFQARAGRLVAQYSAFSPLPGMNVNGEFTLGENIGDLSGLPVAYKAYRIALGDQAAPVLDGFTGDQRFFIGWAQVWARKYRDDELRKRLLTDPHSPSEYRCNGIVRNMPQFVRAFDVKPGDRLYLPPEQMVRIW